MVAPKTAMAIEVIETLAGDTRGAVSVALSAFLFLCFKLGLDDSAILSATEQALAATHKEASGVFLRKHYRAEGKRERGDGRGE